MHSELCYCCEKVSQCSPGWLPTPDLPASASPVRGLQAFAPTHITPDAFCFNKSNFRVKSAHAARM